MSDGYRASSFVEKTHNGVYVKKCNNSNYLAYFALFLIKTSLLFGFIWEKEKNIFLRRIFNLIFNIAIFSCAWYNLNNYNRDLCDGSTYLLRNLILSRYYGE